MFLPRQLDKYTNYNGYICDKRMHVHEVEESRLLKAIAKMQEKYKNPYIRFMWVANNCYHKVTEAMCILYSDKKNDVRVTKIVTFSEAEKLINECLTIKT